MQEVSDGGARRDDKDNDADSENDEDDKEMSQLSDSSKLITLEDNEEILEIPVALNLETGTFIDHHYRHNQSATFELATDQSIKDVESPR